MPHRTLHTRTRAQARMHKCACPHARSHQADARGPPKQRKQTWIRQPLMDAVATCGWMLLRCVFCSWAARALVVLSKAQHGTHRGLWDWWGAATPSTPSEPSVNDFQLRSDKVLGFPAKCERTSVVRCCCCCGPMAPRCSHLPSLPAQVQICPKVPLCLGALFALAAPKQTTAGHLAEMVHNSLPGYAFLGC